MTKNKLQELRKLLEKKATLDAPAVTTGAAKERTWLPEDWGY